jgi:hypothetical protein
MHTRWSELTSHGVAIWRDDAGQGRQQRVRVPPSASNCSFNAVPTGVPALEAVRLSSWHCVTRICCQSSSAQRVRVLFVDNNGVGSASSCWPVRPGVPVGDARWAWLKHKQAKTNTSPRSARRWQRPTIACGHVLVVTGFAGTVCNETGLYVRAQSETDDHCDTGAAVFGHSAHSGGGLHGNIQPWDPSKPTSPGPGAFCAFCACC